MYLGLFHSLSIKYTNFTAYKALAYKDRLYKFHILCNALHEIIIEISLKQPSSTLSDLSI